VVEFAGGGFREWHVAAFAGNWSADVTEWVGASQHWRR
jgi:hypothetical protein